MSITSVLTMILTSSVVSVIVGFIFRYFLLKRENMFSKELEQHKMDLEQQYKEIDQKKHLLNTVKEQISKARRLAMESKDNIYKACENTETLKTVNLHIIESLDKYSSLLMEMDIYEDIHSYKKVISNFINELIKLDNGTDNEIISEKLNSLYTDISKRYESFRTFKLEK